MCLGLETVPAGLVHMTDAEICDGLGAKPTRNHKCLDNAERERTQKTGDKVYFRMHDLRSMYDIVAVTVHQDVDSTQIRM